MEWTKYAFRKRGGGGRRAPLPILFIPWLFCSMNLFTSFLRFFLLSFSLRFSFCIHFIWYLSMFMSRCTWNVFSSPSLKPPAAKIQLISILTKNQKKMNFSDCSKSRFDSLERKFRSFAAILAKNRRITCIMRRVMSISFRNLNLGPNFVFCFYIVIFPYF